MTRVAVFPADREGCGWYRLLFVVDVLRHLAVDVVVRDRIGSVAQRRGADGLLHVDRVTHEPDFDVAVLQRPFARTTAEAIPALQEAGVAVVVDMDDDASALPAQHPTFGLLHPKWSPDHNWRHAEKACRLADLVTVSTPGVARRYGPHGRVRLLRNCVPGAYSAIADHTATAPRVKAAAVTVGWTGAYVAHAGDLAVTRGGVARGLTDECRLVVAEHAEAGAELGVPASRVQVDPWQPLTDGYPHWVSRLDVGIAPLADHRFNEAKSALRGLEYAALGVPFVASPTSEFRWLHDLGAGMLAASPRDWARIVGQLVASPDMRADVAGRGRDAVAEWTFERRADLWMEAWCSALEHRRAA